MSGLRKDAGPDERALWGVVANAGRLSSERKPRWAHVMDATGHGSTRAVELCRRFGFDPEALVAGRAEQDDLPEEGAECSHLYVTDEDAPSTECCQRCGDVRSRPEAQMPIGLPRLNLMDHPDKIRLDFLDQHPGIIIFTSGKQHIRPMIDEAIARHYRHG